MDIRPSVSGLTSAYDQFLFASVCEESNGMQLSVLSALARANLDPWKEAALLSAMPKAMAAALLISNLNQSAGKCWSPAEASMIAARLVSLLPASPGAGRAASADAGVQSPPVRLNLWLLWMSFAIGMAFMTPHQEATTTEAAAVSVSKPDVPSSQNNSGIVAGVSSDKASE